MLTPKYIQNVDIKIQTVLLSLITTAQYKKKKQGKRPPSSLPRPHDRNAQIYSINGINISRSKSTLRPKK